ncbi:hypothetical protein ACFQV2_34145 [Actinokineospora soli]|uniref:Tetracycline repressor TetR C-terminal domain-containing protein n=1 Tax=Actinokineospora soli TaxID=1048753 RepID=A0ABW2TV04_9PSEU
MRAADRFGVLDKMQVMLLLSGYVRNWATLTADIDAAHPDAQEMMAGYGAALRALVDPGEFPELAKVIAAGAFDYNPHEPPDYDFTFGLDRILDGIERITTG